MSEKKNFYGSVFALALPMALQNLINVGVQAADVIMLGKVSETVLSASSLAGQVYFVLTVFIFGLTSGAAVLTAQYWGKRDMDAIGRILGIALRFSLAISTLFTIITLVAPDFLMRLFTSEPEVIAEGVRYLRIIAFSYILSCFTMTFLNTIRSIERVLISSIVYSISLLVNVTLNALLIFGLAGFPKLGIAGAAIATLIARIVEVILLIIYMRVTKLPFHFHLRYLWQKETILLKDFITYALPVIANESIWGLAISTNAAILGHLGKAVVSANSVTGVARQLALVISFGIANAAAILVGKSIGAGLMEKAKLYAKRLQHLSILFGFFGAGIVLAAIPLCHAFLNLSDLAGRYLTFMMIFMSIYCICQSYNTTMIVGIFRGGSDTKYGLKADVSTLWFCAIPLGAILAFVFGLPIYFVYPALLCDEFIKVPMATHHFRGGTWIKNITREKEQL